MRRLITSVSEVRMEREGNMSSGDQLAFSSFPISVWDPHAWDGVSGNVFTDLPGGMSHRGLQVQLTLQ